MELFLIFFSFFVVGLLIFTGIGSVIINYEETKAKKLEIENGNQ